MGVGRFQLGFLSVLYLQRRGNDESCSKLSSSHLRCICESQDGASDSGRGTYHTATFSAVVAETIDPATSGIARAIACTERGT